MNRVQKSKEEEEGANEESFGFCVPKIVPFSQSIQRFMTPKQKMNPPSPIAPTQAKRREPQQRTIESTLSAREPVVIVISDSDEDSIGPVGFIGAAKAAGNKKTRSSAATNRAVVGRETETNRGTNRDTNKNKKTSSNTAANRAVVGRETDTNRDTKERQLLLFHSPDSRLFIFEHNVEFGLLDAISSSAIEWCDSVFKNVHEGLLFWVVDLVSLLCMEFPAQHGANWVCIPMDSTLCVWDEVEEFLDCSKLLINANINIMQLIASRWRSFFDVYPHLQEAQSVYLIGRRINRWNELTFERSWEMSVSNQYKWIGEQDWGEHLQHSKKIRGAVACNVSRGEVPNTQVNFWLRRELVRQIEDRDMKVLHRKWIGGVRENLSELSKYLGQIRVRGDLVVPSFDVRFKQTMCSRTMLEKTTTEEVQRVCEHIANRISDSKPIQKKVERMEMSRKSLDQVSLDSKTNQRYHLVHLFLHNRVPQDKWSSELLYAVFSRPDRSHHVAMEPHITFRGRRTIMNTFGIMLDQALCHIEFKVAPSSLAEWKDSTNNHLLQLFVKNMQRAIPALEYIQESGEEGARRCDSPVVRHEPHSLNNNNNLYWINTNLLSYNPSYSASLVYWCRSSTDDKESSASSLGAYGTNK